ncbi:hypothetical protein DPMN_183669 [Dreissena polymorpha]|uniref:HAT C-terminal dimerisation domain-containing protein n=1 Tax=Dreissena polymorpha TaxID=45954 RepID=A0A9D4DHT1_DREPO|nr:hypothetical protein DPMN_183669 [Dreissena polymorpha]
MASLAILCPVNTTGCERGFSVQNQILTGLNPDDQEMLMSIKINGKPRKDFPFEEALEARKTAVNRKLL